MLLNRAFKKDEVKSVATSKSDFNYDGKYTFYRFYKGYDGFEEIPLDSKYNRMKWKNLINFLLTLNVLKQKQEKHNSKRSELSEMPMGFTKSVIMPTKVIMTLMVS